MGLRRTKISDVADENGTAGTDEQATAVPQGVEAEPDFHGPVSPPHYRADVGCVDVVLLDVQIEADPPRATTAEGIA
jgi:hypothetical protein